VKHVRILGLALVAVFAIAAIAAAGASAASPEWGECVAKAGGKYLDANCQTKGKGGSFEWLKGASLPNHKFTGHNVGSGGVLDAGNNQCEEEDPRGSGKSGPNFDKRVPRAKCANGLTISQGTIAEIECESESNSGEAEGKDKIANVHVTFRGCVLLGSLPCASEGAAEGEIETKPLVGELGYINKANHEVGVRLTPAAKHGRFAKFVCGGKGGFNEILVEVGAGNSKEGAAYLPENKGGNDAIISPITPVDTMTSEFTQVYTVNNTSTTENLPSHFENKPNSLLETYDEQIAGGAHESSMWSPAAEEITNVNTPEVPGEIKG
jgi:hypothetical protein